MTGKSEDGFDKLLHLASENGRAVDALGAALQSRREWLGLSRAEVTRRSHDHLDVAALERGDTLDGLRLYALVLGLRLELRVHLALSPETLDAIQLTADNDESEVF